ncbi:hypothetical protein JCGZ_09362 [Jatropha curcas]|uniref:Uncharacterized protein n=1 Tax=Jatropha curcas TaxID=180498 RepID=D6BRD5_JATCU|nr:uncharacterized protein LOC105636508 [Jatropha curcas]ADB93061.1 hypothetical protein [Jatropha curcas]KDP35203.1 hypothetical protein JCGZ_09362 [Jatropha curcas]
MADIAILVAEEYERRVKNSRKGSGADTKIEVNWVSSISERVKNFKVEQENLEIVKWFLDPKTQIGVAASNGFFSA